MEQTTTQNPQPTTKLWMNALELMAYLDVSQSSVDRFKKECGMPYSKVAMTVRFNRNEIDKWMLEHTCKNAVA